MRYSEIKPQIDEDMSRRGFLNAIGAATTLGVGGMAAKGFVDQQAKQRDKNDARDSARAAQDDEANTPRREFDVKRQPEVQPAQISAKPAQDVVKKQQPEPAQRPKQQPEPVAKTQPPGETGLQGHRQLKRLSTEDAKKHEQYLIAYAKKHLPADQVAPFIAQCSVETAGFKELTEAGNMNYFKKKYDNRKSLKILGNKNFQDALNYLGRGYIHLTGRDNYTRIGNALDLDLVNNPELAMLPENAAKIAVYYWTHRVATKVKDFKNTKEVSRAVNGRRALGLKDRMKKAKEYAISLMPGNKKS